MVNYDKNKKLKIHFFEDLAQFVTNSPNFCKKQEELLSRTPFASWRNGMKE